MNNSSPIMPSTFMQEDLLLSKYIPAVEINARTGERQIDYMDSRFIELLQSIRKATPYLCKGYERLDTISFMHYRTTSLYWLIGLFNGILSPYHLPAGTEILIPDLMDFVAQQNKQPSQVGQTVTL